MPALMMIIEQGGELKSDSIGLVIRDVRFFDRMKTVRPMGLTSTAVQVNRAKERPAVMRIPLIQKDAKASTTSWCSVG